MAKLARSDASSSDTSGRSRQANLGSKIDPGPSTPARIRPPPRPINGATPPGPETSITTTNQSVSAEGMKTLHARLAGLKVDSRTSMGSQPEQAPTSPTVTTPECRTPATSTTSSRHETPVPSPKPEIPTISFVKCNFTGGNVLSDVLYFGSSPGVQPSPSLSASPSTPKGRKSPVGTPTARSPSSRPRTPAPRHEVADEEQADESVHGPSFQKALADTEAAVRSLAEAMAGSSHEQSSVIKGLHKEAKNLQAFRLPDTRTVGLVGDSGVGKSSLINALLDAKDLAHSSNSGEACTSVATEYHYHDHGYFSVNIDLFSEDEFSSQISDLLEAYREYFRGKKATASQVREANANLEDLRKKAEAARCIVEALCGKGETPNLLAQPLEVVVEQLMSIAREKLQDPRVSQTRKACSAEACSQELRLLTSAMCSENGTSLWPLIKKVKVFLNAWILSKGLILVDLPGLRDINVARCKITERSLKECDGVFVVCPIGRAASDDSVKEIFALAKRAKLSHIGIICTKTDDIDADEALLDAKRDKDSVTEARLNSLKGEIEGGRKKVVTLDQLVEDFDKDDDGVPQELTDSELREKCKLDAKRRKEQLMVRQLEFARHKFIVEKRNLRVTQKLNDLYSSATRPEALKVFCVSKKEYWKRRDSPRDVAAPYLELSGILAVRKHCVSLVTEARNRAARGYMKDAVPALLGSVNLWVKSGATSSASAETKKRIRDALNVAEKSLRKGLLSPQSPLRDLNRTIYTSFDDGVLDEATRKCQAWARDARDAAYIWSGWHHMTYAAFCRNHGIHTTPTAGYHNWNAEAIGGMSVSLYVLWENLEKRLTEQRHSILATIWEHFEKSTAALETGGSGVAIPSLQALSSTLAARQRRLRSEYNDAWGEFERKCRILMTDLVSGQHTSVIGELMEPSYRATAREFGTGSDRRRKSIIERKFSDPATFEAIFEVSEQRFWQLAGEVSETLDSAARAHMSAVMQDMAILRTENARLEGEEDLLFHGRVKVALEAARAAMRRIHAVL